MDTEMETEDIIDAPENNKANQIIVTKKEEVEGSLLNKLLNSSTNLTTKPIKLHKKGVVYLSKIPFKMTVTKLMEVLSEYGQIGRIHLVPNERAKESATRIYAEGWVEFARRRDAKMVAATLNNLPVPAKRRNPWYGELWNMKYLPKFEWRFFKEEVSYKNATKKTKLNVEMELAKKEAEKFVMDVEMKKIRKRFGDNSKSGKETENSKTKKSIPLKEPKWKRPKVDHPSQVKRVDSNFMKNLFTGGGL